MLDDALGQFDYVMAMDSLIYYSRPDLANALNKLGSRTNNRVVFTVAPRTPLLMTMWRAGSAVSAVGPVAHNGAPCSVHPDRADHAQTDTAGNLAALQRITSGFYISQAMELVK